MMSCMENKIAEDTTAMGYEDKMLYAFVGNPKKFQWYKKAFAKYDIYGIKEFAWNWSWYAFFFTFFYLLYRKSYKASAILGGFYIVFGSLGGLLGLIINIILGGILPYYVYERYLQKKKDIEKNITDEEIRIEAMYAIGGVNKSIIPMSVIFGVFFIFIYLMITLFY